MWREKRGKIFPLREDPSRGTVPNVTVKINGGLIGFGPDRVPPTPPRKRVIVCCVVNPFPPGVRERGKKNVVGKSCDVKNNPRMMLKESELESAVGFVG